MSNKNKKVILGLIGAAAIGVIAGILLAPDNGNVVRKKIADKAVDLASTIGDFIVSGKDKIVSKANNMASEISAN
ncbi:hypothetical protein BH11BAC3_BH11BAC3_14100 [soil metagenome]